MTLRIATLYLQQQPPLCSEGSPCNLLAVTYLSPPPLPPVQGDTVAFAYGWQTGVASLANFRMITIGSQLSRAITIPPPALMELCDFAHPELFTMGAALATAPQVFL